MHLLTILLGLLLASGASAQDLDQQDLKHALAAYVLTEEAINHLAEFAEEAVEVDSQMPLMPPGLPSSRQVAVDAMVALLNAHPPLKALLAKHHLIQLLQQVFGEAGLDFQLGQALLGG